jgi:hypothetical protein
MPSGLMNIVSYGANDLYLTGAPQITFFKIIYRRYTNFSKESIAININNLDFNKETEVTIPKIGDLLNELYLQISVPSISFLKTDLGITTTDTTTTIASNNYATITKFMKMNVEAYQIAYNNSKALGLPATVMANDIISVFGRFTSSPQTISDYKSILNSANQTYEYSWLDPAQTDISEIVNTISGDLLTDSTSWTPATIFNRLQIAINASVNVQNFFFKQVLEERNNNNNITSQNANFAWVKRLGHAIIDYVDIYIGGEKIDRHRGDWLNVWYELTGNYFQKENYAKLIGDVNNMISFDRTPKPFYNLTIPLSFWFCKQSGLALPLIALQYNQVTLNIKLKTLEECAYVEKNPDIDINNFISISDLWEDGGYNLSGTLLADYVFLDTLERKRFAQSAHEYLIERVQDMLFKNIEDDRMAINLDFRSPCKEIIWFCQKEAYVSNINNYTKCMWDNYGIRADGTGNPVKTARLEFNGYMRVRTCEGSYFNYVQPYAHHRNTPADGINVYSFGLYPEEHQPSSTCNFSRIANATLYLQFDKMAQRYHYSDIDPSTVKPIEQHVSPFPNIWKYSQPLPTQDEINDMPFTPLRIRIFAVSYNILRIIGGMGSLAYN